MKTIFLQVIVVVILVSILAACKKMVTVNDPVNRLTSQVVFTTDKSAVSAVVGLYARMMQTNLFVASNGITVFPGLSAGELNNTMAGSYDEFAQNALSPTNTIIQNNLWAAAYNYIYQANAILNGIQKSSGLSSETKKQLTGEALFIRAFCYFYLTNLFGEVPLITATEFEPNAIKGRESQSVVYAQMEKDLMEAKTNLAEAYPGTGKARPNKWTAATLLARLYLYKHEYQKAETEASAIINSSRYGMESDVNKVFVAGSNETIWQLAPVQPNNNTWEGNLFIPIANNIPIVSIDSSLLKVFESGDLRKASWIKTTTVGTTTYNYPFKYKVKTAATVTENNVVFRLAELYLIRAEARAALLNIDSAKQDINLVRNRSGLNGTPAATVEGLMQAIDQERQVELFAEWGHRWFDLKRTGKVNDVMKILKGASWQATDTLYPIPALEIQRNASLTQNPGY